MAADMNAVLDNLYIGSFAAVLNTKKLKSVGITHILTVLDRPLTRDISSQFHVKYIHALDTDDTDLLSYFEECIYFIQDGRNHGAVLVHCQAGMSRSVTVTVAYLMSVCHMSLDDAMTFVKKQRPTVNPNEGFMRQLRIFEVMNMKIEEDHPSYRLFRLERLASRVQAGMLQGALSSSDLTAVVASGTDVSYKCRRCRQTLFYSSVILPHKEGIGESAFDWRGKTADAEKRKAVTSDGTMCKKSLFIEPLQWMAGSIETIDGKLGCPKCRSKLGSFVWYGEKCPCGAWVAPAFHIQWSKVDECKPVTAASSHVNAISHSKPINSGDSSAAAS